MLTHRYTHAAVLLAILLLAGCGGNKIPPSLTPVGVAAWKAEKVLIAFEGIQDAAMALNQVRKCDTDGANCRPAFSTDNTRIVVRAVRVATDTIEASPLGWRPATLAGLDTMRTQLDAAGKTDLSAWLLVVETILLEP